jgi:hypothetical protein
MINKAMKNHLLLSLALLPLWTASAAILQMPLKTESSTHPCGTIVGGFGSESASGKPKKKPERMSRIERIANTGDLTLGSRMCLSARTPSATSVIWILSSLNKVHAEL